VSPLADVLRPDSAALALAFVVDLALGDPVYRAHPIRLIGESLRWFEGRLRALGFDGYGGGVVLFVLLAIGWLSVLVGLMALVLRVSPKLAWMTHAAVLYTMLALGDLLHHVWRIETAVRSGDIDRARTAVGALVGRDTDRMDAAACRRAAVESLSENLTDGFVSAVFWYILLGLPGIMLFKIVSTMDSMVGYKTPQYLRFGWCGARLDDAMNYLPARLTWLLIVVIALILPGLSGRKAWRVGLDQHAVLLGPNSGWSEAAAAGALQRRIVGPIWLRGVQVTDVWVGDPADPPVSEAADVGRAMLLTTTVGVVVVVLGGVLIQPLPFPFALSLRAAFFRSLVPRSTVHAGTRVERSGSRL
jgi:adenosylcobinamide-phosphate synthase